MAKILIPRSDSVDVKVIEPSDFEKYFSSDLLNDYIVSGFTLSAGTGLAVNIAAGTGRLKGLFVNNSTSSSKGSLAANNTNYIYVTLTRDSNSEAESWNFTSNTSGTTPTDSLFIGTATTNGSGVTAVGTTNVLTQHGLFKKDTYYFGDGHDGDVTISSNTTLTESKEYNNLTINSGVTLSGNRLIIQVADTLTVNGTISTNGQGGAGSTSGGAGGAGGTGTWGGSGSGGTAGGNGVKGFGINSNGGNAGNGGSGGGGSSSGHNAGSGGSKGNYTAITYVDYKIDYYKTSLVTLPIGFGGGGGAGGGGGGGRGVNQYNTGGTGGGGGAGGNGGGSILIIAKTINIASGGVISSNGNNGSAGGAGVNSATGGGGGGGGGAGGGGMVMLIYQNTFTNNGSITATGGTGGAGGAGGTGNSGAGSAGGAGSNGSAGVTKTYQIPT